MHREWDKLNTIHNGMYIRSHPLVMASNVEKNMLKKFNTIRHINNKNVLCVYIFIAKEGENMSSKYNK